MLKPLAHSLTHMHTFPKTRSNSPNSYLFFRVSAYAWSIKHDHDYAVFILFSAFIAVFLSLALSPLPFSYIDMLWAYGFYLESISGKNVEAPKTNGFTVHFWCVFLFRLIFIFSLSNGYSTATEQQRHRGTSKHKRELTFSRLKRAREMIETISKKFRNLLFLTMRRFPTFLVAIRILFTSCICGSFHFGERLPLIIIWSTAIAIWLRMKNNKQRLCGKVTEIPNKFILRSIAFRLVSFSSLHIQVFRSSKELWQVKAPFHLLLGIVPNLCNFLESNRISAAILTRW